MVVYNEYEAFASEAMSMFKSNPVFFRLVLKYRVDPQTPSTSTSSSSASATSTSTSAVSSLASSTATTAAAAAPGRLVVRATDSTRTLVFKTRELQDLKNCERLQLWLLNETATNESLFAKAISELAEEEKKKKNDKSQGVEAMKVKGVGAGQKRQYPKMSGAQRRKARRLEKASLGPEGLAASRVKSDVERAREEKAAIKKARKAERRLTRQLSREQ
jgi:hypothetical protein